MANPHFANLGDVWKHLLLTEVISSLRPGQYVETHAGSAIYRLAGDAERGLGAEMFLSASSGIEPMRSRPYRRHILEFARGAELSYPGLPLLAMMLLGRTCRYVFCDTDAASVADLRAAREHFGLRDEVRVIHGDRIAETTALLQAHAIGAASRCTSMPVYTSRPASSYPLRDWLRTPRQQRRGKRARASQSARVSSYTT
jgi:23S rRNA A2030 N6-methylase RlmJ